MINVLRRRDPEQRRLRRGMYLLPSLFTLANMFCGYACVIFAMRGEFSTAAPFIGVAVVLDLLDGRIARMTGATVGLRPRIRLAGRRDLVRHRAGRPRLRVGPLHVRAAGLGGRLPVRLGGGDPPGPLQHPDHRQPRQAVLRRHAQSGRRRRAGGDGVPAAAGVARRLDGRPGPAAAARAGGPDGQHDPLPQLQDVQPEHAGVRPAR